MAEELTPILAEPPDPYYKARDILNSMSEYRIDPRRIKTADSGRKTKGGQGTVVVGTLIPPEAVRTWIPERFLEKLFEAKFAIKKLKWDREDAEESVKFFKSFVNELSIMAELSHSNIVQFVGFVEDMQKGDAWIVLPWEENGNVREFLQSGEWDIPERISLIQDVIQGVEYLHTRRRPICHGDLKSLNILVNSSYRAVITDFGSARSEPNAEQMEHTTLEEPRHATNNDTSRRLTSPKIDFNCNTLELTLTGSLGTLRWAAPEVLAGEAKSLLSDMWAVGWICWEVVTGKIPFEELSREETVIARVVAGKLPKIREEAQLSHVLQLCGLMSDCWISDPAGRIGASDFRRGASSIPSIAPSGCAPGVSKIRSAELLLALGGMYWRQDKGAMAESHYMSALDVTSRTNNHMARADALHGLGEIYRTQSRNQEGEKAFREELEIHSRIGNTSGSANALRGLGEVYRAQSRYRDAEKAFREAYDIHSRTGDDQAAANALHSLGELYRLQSKSAEAENTLGEAHEIYSRIGDDLGTANALDGLGEIYHSKSRNAEAEKAFTEAHGIHSRIGNHLGAANALLGLGETFSVQSRNREAEKALREAHSIHSRIGNAIGMAAALFCQGNVYRAELRYREAEQALRQAHETYSRIGETVGMGNALDVLGILFGEQKRYEEAQSSFCDALFAYNFVGSHASRAYTLLRLAQIYRIRDNYPQAEEMIAEALTTGVRLNDNRVQESALKVLAPIFSYGSKYSVTLAAPLPARAACDRMGDDHRHAAALHDLGKRFLVQSKYGQADESYRLACALFSRAGDGRGEASALRSLGTLYNVQERLELATERFAQARRTSAGISDHEGELRALGCLMGVCLQQPNLAGLRSYCVDALKLCARTRWSNNKVCAAS